MSDYLAQYTVYLSNDEQERESGRKLLKSNPVVFFQGWDVKGFCSHRFSADDEEKAIGTADRYKQGIYVPGSHVITVTLDELLEVRPVNIRNEGMFKKIGLDEACETIVKQNSILEEYEAKRAVLDGSRDIDKEFTSFSEKAEGYRRQFNETELAMISERITIKKVKEGDN